MYVSPLEKCPRGFGFFFSLAIEFHEFFKNMFRTLNPNKIYICQRFVSFGRLIFLMSPLLCRSFKFNIVLHAYFAFVASAFGVNSKKPSPRPMSRSLPPMFSSRS